jgi:hypothetical protein
MLWGGELGLLVTRSHFESIPVGTPVGEAAAVAVDETLPIGQVGDEPLPGISGGWPKAPITAIVPTRLPAE